MCGVLGKRSGNGGGRGREGGVSVRGRCHHDGWSVKRESGRRMPRSGFMAEYRERCISRERRRTGFMGAVYMSFS